MVGSYEAKTHLPRLLDQVARGERITITRHGVPIAVLVPVSSEERRDVAEVVADLRRFRSDHSLGDSTLRELIEDGRS
jgi:prevent-host-death family protein